MELAFQEIKEGIWKRKTEAKILIAAHRGTSGGNIIPNTIPAFENALRHGSDILEIDAARTSDGVFHAFHDGQEPALLGTSRNIRTMTSDEVNQLHQRNTVFEAVDEKVNRLDDVLEHFKGRCLINIDRSWFYWPEIINLINRHSMRDQIILKSPANVELLECLEESGKSILYMPIVYKPEDLKLAQNRKIRMIAAEIIFDSKDNLLVAPEMIDQYHRDGLLVWANAITLNDWTNLCAHCDDNNSVMFGPDEYWGWLIRRGFDILQTDWPLLLKTYVQSQKVMGSV
jgi:glycerophosphoryl diester phosphodiesterase